MYFDPSGYIRIPSGSGCSTSNFNDEDNDSNPFRENRTPDERDRYDKYWREKIYATELGPFAGESILSISQVSIFLHKTTHNRIVICPRLYS